MRKRTDYIVVHCSATPASMDVDAKLIDRWHRQKGWLKIGYHFVIKRDGTVESGRKLDEAGAHVYGHNQHSIGICMVGGMTEDMRYPEDNFTAAQWASLKALLVEMKGLYPNADVLGHRDLDPNKACPSFDMISKWNEWFPEKGESHVDVADGDNDQSDKRDLRSTPDA